MTETLSVEQARKLVLLSQWLPWIKPAGKAMDGTLSAVCHLGYIQIDTISVIARAHHHTLWNRNRRYQPAHLTQLLAEKKIFEYWSHAAAYLPMADYRFSLRPMRAYATGQRHWFEPNPKMMKSVLRRVAREGPLRAQDFEGERGKADMWDWKPAKQALEQLFMAGTLMVLRRQGFHKVYDLAERVLPPGVDTTLPSETEQARFLITRFLQANGLGQAAEIAYQRRGVKPMVARCLADMTAQGEVIQLGVKGEIYYALPASLGLLHQPLQRKRLKILSPFDNLLIQRKRVQHLFDFDYRIECYTPAHKRKHGYFSLPLLWNGKLVARMDCKAERRERVLVIRDFVSEDSFKHKSPLVESLVESLVTELAHFARFNQCARVRVEKLQDGVVERLLKDSI